MLLFYKYSSIHSPLQSYPSSSLIHSCIHSLTRSLFIHMPHTFNSLPISLITHPHIHLPVADLVINPPNDYAYTHLSFIFAFKSFQALVPTHHLFTHLHPLTLTRKIKKNVLHIDKHIHTWDEMGSWCRSSVFLTGLSLSTLLNYLLLSTPRNLEFQIIRIGKVVKSETE